MNRISHGEPSRAWAVQWTVAILITSLFATLPVRGDEEAAAFSRPKFSPSQRQNEDWSVMANQPADAPGDYIDAIVDPLKHLTLTDDGYVWVNFGASLRQRLEGWSNFNFARPADTDNDDAFLLTRIRPFSDVHIGANIRIFTELKSALATDRSLTGGHRGLDMDTIDLQQLFVDWTIPLDNGNSIVIRGGRQQMLLGSQRLISPLIWSNTMRTWDGLTIIANINDWTFTGFWNEFAAVKKYQFNDHAAQFNVWGLWVDAPGVAGLQDLPGSENAKTALYYIGIDRRAAAFNGTAGWETRHTLGGRLTGKCPYTGINGDLEGAYQFGKIGAADISAYMVALKLSYLFDGVSGAPKIHGGFDYASGDDTAGSDVETFNQLFPLGHKYLGYMDSIGRQNIIAANLGLTGKACKNVTLDVTGHVFWRAEGADALYNAGAAALPTPGGASTSKYVGAELDLTAKIKVSNHLNVLLGYSHFFTGDYIDNTGPAKDVDFFYTQWTLLF